jgi:hypothetical protein
VLLNLLPIFGHDEIYFLLNVGGVESEDRLVVFDDFFVQLKRQNIDDIDISLDGLENASNLIVLSLFETFHRQPFELLH